MSLRYLITGTGRCGTGYMAQVLRSAGIKCGHEDVFGLGGLEYARQVMGDWEAESSWLAAPFLDDPLLEEVTVVHLVRDPKKVIDSWLGLGYLQGDSPVYHAWMCAHLPWLLSWADPEHRAAAIYIGWNKMIKDKTHATIFHRVEDDPVVLLDRLQIDYRGKKLFSDKTYNTRRPRREADVTLQALPDSLREALREMQHGYGYHIFAEEGETV